ncbi:MAG: DsbA family oxidoreductase [Pseudomonadota bacterium]
MSAGTTQAPALQIDVWFDLICPWCLIGKRHLDSALAEWRRQRPTDAVAVRWHPVRLIDGVPAEGWDYAVFYERRLGSAQAVIARQAQVRLAAQQAGLAIAFERIQRFPDTAPAHQLLALAGRQLGPQAQETLVDRLFQGYFQQGQDLGSHSWLLQIAAESGLDLAEAQAQLGLNLPSAPPVPGVPFFVFYERLALSGAQPPAALLEAMHNALADASAAAR